MLSLGQGADAAAASAPGAWRGTLPCHSTITQALRVVDVASLEAAIGLACGGATLPEGTHVAVDGKTLRGSRCDQHQGVHLLAAFAVQLKRVVAQQAVAQGRNEASALLEFLDTLDIRGAILTGDAAFTQPAIGRKITDKGADYLFTVKDNKPALRRTVDQAFAAEAAFSPGDAS